MRIPLLIAAPLWAIGVAPSMAITGMTHLLIGQNWQTEFSDYSTATASLPAGASFYTAQLVEGQSIMWMGDGLPFVEYTNQSFAKNEGLAEVTLAWKYADGGCDAIRQISLDIADGKFDSQLDELANTFISMSSLTWLLRIEYEVSYSLFTCKDPGPTCDDMSYQSAFQHVAQFLRGKADNVKFVFHVMYGDLDAPCMYPGDDAVDIIGVSFFEGENDDCYLIYDCVNPNVNATLAWARESAPTKDLFFPESTPQNIDSAEWLTTFIEHMQWFIELYDVRYWTYINMDWTAQGWGNDPWGDSRIQQTESTLEFWQTNVLGNARYLCAGGTPCDGNER